MDQEIIQLASDLGGTVGSLLACFWYIKYLTDRFNEERREWMAKDSESDSALRDLMATSNQQLLQVLQESNRIMQEMKIALTRLEETLKISKSSGNQ